VTARGAPAPLRRRWPVRKIAVGAGLAGYSWLAAGTAPFSLTALLIVLLPGLVLAAIAFGCPPERIPAPDRIDAAGFSYWAICVAVLFEWEAAAFKDNAPWWHPSLTQLVNELIQARPVKSIAVLIWLLAGWALVRRLTDDHQDRHDRRLRRCDQRPVRPGVPGPAGRGPHADPGPVARVRHAAPGRPGAHPARLALARVALLREVAGPANPLSWPA
jgi:hypothetical protein